MSDLDKNLLSATGDQETHNGDRVTSMGKHTKPKGQGDLSPGLGLASYRLCCLGSLVTRKSLGGTLERNLREGHPGPLGHGYTSGSLLISKK